MTNTIRPMRFMGRQFSTPFLMLGVSGLLVATPTLAQTDVGLKGGLNLSRFYGENIGESTTRQGHIFGAFLNTGLWGPFSVQPEAYYSRRGATGGDIHTETLGDVTNWLWNYNYLDFVPVLKLRVTPGRMVAHLERLRWADRIIPCRSQSDRYQVQSPGPAL